MINTVRDAKRALEILTGSCHTPILGMDERIYQFYEEFIKPVFQNADLPHVTGFVEVFAEEVRHTAQVRFLAKLNHGHLPYYAWPGGCAIVYKDQLGDPLCAVCAEYIMASEPTDSTRQPTYWDVDWEGNDLVQCSECHEFVYPLESFQ